MRAAMLALALSSAMMLSLPHDTADTSSREPPLPRIASAPPFTLISQDGATVGLADFRGKAVAVTFIYTLCTDTCPVFTPMMSFIQDRLRPHFGRRIAFVSITLDPERDTPTVLKEYSQAFGADLSGWAFLTGAPEVIREVVR